MSDSGKMKKLEACVWSSLGLTTPFRDRIITAGMHPENPSKTPYFLLKTTSITSHQSGWPGENKILVSLQCFPPSHTQTNAYCWAAVAQEVEWVDWQSERSRCPWPRYLPLTNPDELAVAVNVWHCCRCRNVCMNGWMVGNNCKTLWVITKALYKADHLPFAHPPIHPPLTIKPAVW